MQKTFRTLHFTNFIFRKHSYSIQISYICAQYALCIQNLEKKAQHVHKYIFQLKYQSHLNRASQESSTEYQYPKNINE